MESKRMLTFRAQGIPLGFLKRDVEDLFKQPMTTAERSSCRIDILLVPSYHASPRFKDALLQFHPASPTFLADIARDNTGLKKYYFRFERNVISVDSGFFGLTQISEKPLAETNLDIVFITGLDGNAYGSWAGRHSGAMWPSDFLAFDLPIARVLIYGYNSKLKNDTFHTLDDFCVQFLEDIQLARDSDAVAHANSSSRPSTALSYSLGTATASLVKCKVRDGIRFYKALLTSLKTIVFFGAPHRGIDTEDTELYLDAQLSASPVSEPRKALVAELRRGNEAAERELQDFKDLVGTVLKIQIISVYERHASQRLVLNARDIHTDSEIQTGRTVSWKRTGQLYRPLEDGSSLLGFPTSMEIRIPSDANHSNITKFDHRDITYHLLLRELVKICSLETPEQKCEAQGTGAVLAERDNLRQEALALGSPDIFETEPQWLPYESLYFPDDQQLESIPNRFSWLTEAIKFFVQGSDLRLKPRRFGVLKHGNEHENVMVEFRHYSNHEEVREHLMRREAFVSTARMLLWSRHGVYQLPAVPLRGISIMAESETPSFLFVYKADDLISLEEAFDLLNKPTVEERVWLALQWAQALQALHSLKTCHGLINPHNLYMKLPRNREITANSKISLSLANQRPLPLLAGFEIARQVSGKTDLIDVEDQDWRVYQHKDRLGQGDDKERQTYAHDIFSLGMVLIVIGHWLPFTSFRKYQEAADDKQRRAFSMKLGKAFQSADASETMPSDYRDVVSCCLGRRSVTTGDGQETETKARNVVSIEWVVKTLEGMLQDHCTTKMS
ncbi:hypothetical protein BX600DRAFT_530593 [Xylariales sp. PMI_506]|nr:hypothetical protein BX600DRAFT_530593 [Xylariales sp. PMI_506]